MGRSEPSTTVWSRRLRRSWRTSTRAYGTAWACETRASRRSFLRFYPSEAITMTVPIALSQCMKDLGPLLEAGEVVEFADLNLWTMVLDGDVVIHAEHDEECRHLVLTADVAPVPAARRQELFDLLL